MKSQSKIDSCLVRVIRMSCARNNASLKFKSSSLILVSITVVGLCVLPAVATDVRAERIATGLNQPVYVTSPTGDTERLFIVEQHSGCIKILNRSNNSINVEPFLEIDGLATGYEQGLLGLAFDPNFSMNGYFYVNLNLSSGGTTQIRRYRVLDSDPNQADPASQTLIMTFDQPFPNHNGGWLDFGPDGYLYIATGDGGSANDPGNRAQDITNQKLGKLLRIDVNGDDFPDDPMRHYRVPPSNPFVGMEGDDEIWAYGLRNPWRCSFDRLTGDLYIGDVGEGAREEVDIQPAASVGGENYGWSIMEGNACHFANEAIPCFDASLVMPVHDYLHTGAPDGGFSITGGYVYRGSMAQIQGVYFFADYLSQQIWSFRYQDGLVTEFQNRTESLTPEMGTIGSISSFGEDADGNLYMTDLDGGEVFKLVCAANFAADFDSDCDVDDDDFAALAGAWETTQDDPDWDSRFDLAEPKDGKVDILDLAAFMDQWVEDRFEGNQ